MPSRRDSFVEPEPSPGSAGAGDRRAEEPDPRAVRATGGYLGVGLVLALGVAASVVAAVYAPTRHSLTTDANRAEAGAAAVVAPVASEDLAALQQVDGVTSAAVLRSGSSALSVTAADAGALADVVTPVRALVDPARLADALATDPVGLALPEGTERLVFALQGDGAAVEGVWVLGPDGGAARVPASGSVAELPDGAASVVGFDIALRSAEPSSLGDAVFGVTAEQGSVLQGLGGTEDWALVGSTVTSADGVLRGRVVPDATPELPVVLSDDASRRLSVDAGDTLTVELEGSRTTGRVVEVAPVVPGGDDVLAALPAVSAAIVAGGAGAPERFEVWAAGDAGALERLADAAPPDAELTRADDGDAGPLAAGLWVASLVLLTAGLAGLAALALSPPSALRGLRLGRARAADLLGVVAPPALLGLGSTLVGAAAGAGAAVLAVPSLVRWGLPVLPPDAAVALELDRGALAAVLGVLLTVVALVVGVAAMPTRRSRVEDAGPRRTGEIPIIPTTPPSGTAVAEPVDPRSVPALDADVEDDAAEADGAEEDGAPDAPRSAGSAVHEERVLPRPPAETRRGRASHRAPGEPDTGPVPIRRRASHRAPGEPDTGPIPRQDDGA